MSGDCHAGCRSAHVAQVRPSRGNYIRQQHKELTADNQVQAVQLQLQELFSKVHAELARTGTTSAPNARLVTSIQLLLRSPARHAKHDDAKRPEPGTDAQTRRDLSQTEWAATTRNEDWRRAVRQ